MQTPFPSGFWTSLLGWKPNYGGTLVKTAFWVLRGNLAYLAKIIYKLYLSHSRISLDWIFGRKMKFGSNFIFGPPHRENRQKIVKIGLKWHFWGLKWHLVSVPWYKLTFFYCKKIKSVKKLQFWVAKVVFLWAIS